MFTLSAVLYPIAGVVGLIISLALVGLVTRRHSPKVAVLKPAITKTNPGEPVVLHNIIINVRWPINN